MVRPFMVDVEDDAQSLTSWSGGVFKEV